MHRRGSIRTLLIACSLLLATAGYTQSPAPAPWRPSPTGAAFRSLFLPGWGQAYNQHHLKAVIYGGIEEGLIYGVYRQHQLFMDARHDGDEPLALAFKEDRNRMTWMLSGVVILSMVDAYVDAHLFDFDVSDKLTLSLPPDPKQIQINFAWIWR